jgi:hypothetical protein
MHVIPRRLVVLAFTEFRELSLSGRAPAARFAHVVVNRCGLGELVA